MSEQITDPTDAGISDDEQITDPEMQVVRPTDADPATPATLSPGLKYVLQTMFGASKLWGIVPERRDTSSN